MVSFVKDNIIVLFTIFTGICFTLMGFGLFVFGALWFGIFVGIILGWVIKALIELDKEDK